MCIWKNVSVKGQVLQKLPVLFFCFFGLMLTGIMSIYGYPWGRQSMKEITYEVATSHIDVGFKERTFNDSFKDVMLYIRFQHWHSTRNESPCSKLQGIKIV